MGLLKIIQNIMFEKFKASLRGPEPEPKPRIRGNDELDRQEREARLKKDVEEGKRLDELKRQERYKQEGRNEDGTLKPETAEKLKVQLQETENKMKEISETIARKKEEWRNTEQKNYALRNKVGDKTVDFIKLRKGDVAERDKYNAHESVKKDTAREMENIQTEIKGLEQQKLDLMIEKQKIENALTESKS